MSSLTKRTCRSTFPVLNVKRRSDPVATDTVCYDAPAIDDGSKCSQELAGKKLLCVMFAA